MELTLDTWIISDTHFGHKNIVKYCDRPMEHNDIMEDNWWRLVGDNDDILHLGDLTVWYDRQDLREWMEVASELPGNKYMLRGNHDPLSDLDYLGYGYTIVPEFAQLFDEGLILFSHYPDDPKTREWDTNIHGHIHNLKSPDKQYINVSVKMMNYKPWRLGDVLYGS